MAKKRDYSVELQREYDEVASRSSGVTRSEAQRKAEKEVSDRMKRAEKSGAGRGLAPASAYKRDKRKSRRD